MTTRSIRVVATLASLVVLFPAGLIAQIGRNVVPLTSWPAPLYFQPTRAESQGRAKPDLKPDALNAVSDEAASLAATPAGSLVFVAMTPCRIADTRDGGFPAGFGPPTLSGNASRTFAIQSSTSLCPVPSIAQAYSFNITVVPPGVTFPGNVNPSGALGYLTIWPTGVPQPVVSTLNSFLGTVAANAAIVPAGTGGSVNVFVFNSTDLIIDINGYYAPQSGITLAQGTSSSPSLSFAGDPGTGIFSSGAGTLNLATGGTSRVQISNGAQALQVNGITSLGGPGSVYGQLVDGPSPGPYPSLGLNAFYNSSSSSYLAGVGGYGGIFQFQDGDGKLGFYSTASSVAAGSPHTFTPRLIILNNGNVGIGTTTPSTKLHVDGGGSGDGVFGQSTNGIGVHGSGGAYGVYGTSPSLGVYGNSPSLGVYGTGGDTGVNGSGGAYGVYGTSTSGNGVYGTSNSYYGVEGGSTDSIGVYGHSVNHIGVYGGSEHNYAGWFNASVRVQGTVVQDSDARLKQGVANLGYGLHEVLQLRPVTWKWKEKPERGVQLGLIAQEVESVLPELVATDEDGERMKGLNYIGLVPVTIKAIQEQQAQIEDQQKRISEQQERIVQQQEQNRKLEERLAALENLLSTRSSSTTEDR